MSDLAKGVARLRCVYTGRTHDIPCGGLVPVTSREPVDGLVRELAGVGLATLLAIGDCRAPGLIAQAVWSGHKAAREWGLPEAERGVWRERTLVSGAAG